MRSGPAERASIPPRTRRLVIQWIGLVSSLSVAGVSPADVFPCSEAGLDAAITAADAGDAGPHELSCMEGESFSILGQRSIASSLVLDASGGEVRCVEDRPVAFCSNTLWLSAQPTCVPPACETPEYGERIQVELSHIGVRGVIGVLRAADAVLSHVSVVPRDDPFQDVGGVRLQRSGGRFPAPTGTLHLVDSHIVGPDFPGAVAVSTDANAVIERTTIEGGLLVGDAAVTLVNSTVDGIANGGNLAMINSTINSVPISGLPPDLPGNFRPAYSDETRMQCGFGAILISVGHATSVNTVIDGYCRIGQPAPDPLPLDCADIELPPPGTLTSLGGNLERGGDTCGFVDETDQVELTIEQLALGDLTDNGGPTPTRALLSGSLAREAGILDSCPFEDQRGEPRPEPEGTRCDSGAFEAVPEPGAAGLALAAFAALATAARRRPH